MAMFKETGFSSSRSRVRNSTSEKMNSTGICGVAGKCEVRKIYRNSFVGLESPPSSLSLASQNFPKGLKASLRAPPQPKTKATMSDWAGCLCLQCIREKEVGVVEDLGECLALNR